MSFSEVDRDPQVHSSGHYRAVSVPEHTFYTQHYTNTAPDTVTGGEHVSPDLVINGDDEHEIVICGNVMLDIPLKTER